MAITKTLQENKVLIREIIKIVRNNRGLVIVNEVTTGIGRTGKWFGYQHYDIKPDMIAIGKGIGNGYPVSVAVFSRALSDKLGSFKYSQSHQNDPLGAAVALEVVKTIKDNNLIRDAKEKGDLFFSQLKSLEKGFEAQNGQIEIRGRGLMFAIDFNDEEYANRIYNKLLKSGFIVCNRGTILRIDPPLIIKENEFLKFNDVLFAAVGKHCSSKIAIQNEQVPK